MSNYMTSAAKYPSRANIHSKQGSKVRCKDLLDINVFMDRYFTSYSIVQHLLELGLTAVGTVSANRRDVPLCLRNTRGHDVYSTLAVYEHSKNYVPRKNKNVLLMSSCHTKLKIDTSEMTEDQTS
ncbi:hypothetical protein T09_1078 [Trichinella sp. T9]|nr:hypothetical protein T09_1078 [Trichinella sp. T9]